MSRKSAVRQLRASSFRAVSLVSAPLVALPLLATGTAHAAPIVSAVRCPAAAHAAGHPAGGHRRRTELSAAENL